MFNRVFHHKPFILGAHPYFWKHPHVATFKLCNLNFRILDLESITSKKSCQQKSFFLSPQMVKIMENPMNKWMIWGETPICWSHSPLSSSHSFHHWRSYCLEDGQAQDGENVSGWLGPNPHRFKPWSERSFGRGTTQPDP